MTYTTSVRTTTNIRDQALDLCKQKAEETGSSGLSWTDPLSNSGVMENR
jgi:hypothetical protein